MLRSSKLFNTSLFKRYISQHKDTDYNNTNTPFDFTPENYIKVKQILALYPNNYKHSASMPLLDLAQRQNNNWIPLSAMNKIAEICEVPPIRIYETCSFYSMYNREPVGKYLLQVCGTTPCMLCGAEDIIHSIEKHLGIHCGQTTKDKVFTLMEVECLGACVNAPMMQVNDDCFEDLTPSNTIALLDNLKSGKSVKIGPQNNRVNCGGTLGNTTLLGEIAGPTSRDFDALKIELAAKAAAAPKK